MKKSWTRCEYGWLSPDGLVFAERGAPMTCGGTAWLVWVRAVDGEVEADEYGAHVVRPRRGGSYTDPVRRLSEIANGDVIYPYGPWFVHLGDAGSLAEAKVAGGVLVARTPSGLTPG